MCDTPTQFQLASDNRRLDIQLAEHTGLTRSRIATLLAEGRCTVNGIPATKAGLKPASGASIILTLPPPKPATPQAEDIPITILYEDEALAVVVKPAGMVVHPAAGNETGTLVNALLYQLDSLSGIGGEIRPGIVHRLDKDTSGLLLIAKNDAAQLSLSQQLADRAMEKHYLALVEGTMKEPSGFIDAPIARHRTDRKKMAVDPAGRPSQTEWKALAEGHGCTLLDVHILTGRTHQIRVHMRHIGHPVCGDVIYGLSHGTKVPRLMLHAWQLTFTHPTTGKTMTFRAPVPEAFCKGLQSGRVTVPDGLFKTEEVSL